MIIFHEGLPGSGKSYESVVHHILPTLKSGRVVCAFVEGLDVRKISELLVVEPSYIESLLITVEREDVPRIWEIAPDNSFVVIDELQNFFPAGKQKLDDRITQFVTEHRHRGIDILAMGQDLRDCHALWKRRVDQKTTFMKLDMLGKQSSYKWVVYKATSGEKFQQVTAGVSHYDKKYFGSYKSHVSDLTRVENYKDSRSVIWNNRLLQFGILFVIATIFIAVPHLFKTFSSESGLIQKKSSASFVGATSVPVLAPVAAPVSAPVAASVSAPVAAPVSVPAPVLPLDYVSNLATKYRIRLFCVLVSPSRIPYAVVEFRDDSYRVQERLNSETLLYLGWEVQIVSLHLIKIVKNGTEFIVTPWPISEPVGRVSEEKNREIRSDIRSDRTGQEIQQVKPFPRDGGISGT